MRGDVWRTTLTKHITIYIVAKATIAYKLIELCFDKWDVVLMGRKHGCNGLEEGRTSLRCILPIEPGVSEDVYIDPAKKSTRVPKTLDSIR